MLPVFGQRISCQETGTMVAPIVENMRHIRKHARLMLTGLTLRKNDPKVVSGSSDIVAS